MACSCCKQLHTESLAHVGLTPNPVPAFCGSTCTSAALSYAILRGTSSTHTVRVSPLLPTHISPAPAPGLHCSHPAMHCTTHCTAELPACHCTPTAPQTPQPSPPAVTMRTAVTPAQQQAAARCTPAAAWAATWTTCSRRQACLGRRARPRRSRCGSVYFMAAVRQAHALPISCCVACGMSFNLASFVFLRRC